MDLKHLSCKSTRWEEGFEILSRAKMSISGRYHPSIMALCGITPCFFISANNCKMLGTHDYFHSNESSYVHSHKLKESSEKIFNWVSDDSAKRLYTSETILGLKKVTENLEEAKSQILGYLK